MAATARFDLTALWQEIHVGTALVTVEEGSAIVHLADTAVDGDADVPSHTLSGTGASFTNGNSALRIYAKRANDGERSAVSVSPGA